MNKENEKERTGGVLALKHKPTYMDQQADIRDRAVSFIFTGRNVLVEGQAREEYLANRKNVIRNYLPDHEVLFNAVKNLENEPALAESLIEQARTEAEYKRNPNKIKINRNIDTVLPTGKVIKLSLGEHRLYNTLAVSEDYMTVEALSEKMAIDGHILAQSYIKKLMGGLKFVLSDSDYYIKTSTRPVKGLPLLYKLQEKGKKTETRRKR